MNIFSISALLSAIVSIFMGNFVLYRNSREKLNRIFFILAMLLAYCSFWEFEYLRAPDYNTALFWIKSGTLWTFSTSLLLHFILVFTEKTSLLRNKLIYPALYLPSLIFMLLDIKFAEPVKSYWGWVYSMPNKPINIVVDIWILITGFLAVFICLSYYLKAADFRKKKQAKYILAGITIPVLIGSVFDQAEEFFYNRIPEIAPVAYVIGCALFGYAIYKYELFGISSSVKSILSDITDSLILTDKEQNVTTVNKTALSLLGMQEPDLTGKPVDEIFAQAEKYNFRSSILKRLQETKNIHNLKVNLKNNGGRSIQVSMSISMLRDKYGDEIGSLYIFKSISEFSYYEHEIEKLKAQLLKSQKLAEIGTLATGIAHEFKNIIQISNSYVEFALKTKKTEDIEEALKMSLNTSERASKIITDILAFSRYGTSEKETCDVAVNIDSVLSFVENQLKISNILVMKNYRKTPKISANKEELKQVFLNIILNARDAMYPEGGKLEISIKQVDKYIEIIFTDTGKGIEPDSLKRLFEPFYTTKDTLHGDSISGTGLGLYVSQGIIKAHDGTIEVASEIGKGSLFTIKLPIGAAIPEIIETKTEPVPEKSPSRKILVIDDEKEIGKIIQRFLTSDGHDVKYVFSREIGLKLMKQEHFDIIIMDVVMPGMPCVDALDKIKEISPEIKIIMMSGKYIDAEMLAIFKQKNTSGFVQKPFNMEEIKKFIAA